MHADPEHKLPSLHSIVDICGILNCPCLEFPYLNAAAGGVVKPRSPYCDRSVAGALGTRSIAYSARAAIVSAGLTPGFAGSAAASQTIMFS